MIGRKKEIKELNKLYDKKHAELVAVYGRRRIGKTFLIDETFSGRITFRHAGLAPDDNDSVGFLQAQLEHFYGSLELFGMEPSEKPKTWLEAFLLLEKFLQKIDDGSRQVVFLDELPWLDSPKSGFMRAFEGFWNNWGCHRSNLMVIVCGSANSWILDNLINNRGGLYNRVTYEIKLSPFTLSECEEFFESNNVRLSRYDIVQSYMILGGIPYYLGYFDGELSLAQNIDNIIFDSNAKLRDEYNRLFDSIFSNPEVIKKIVRFLFSRNAGYTRSEISKALDISDGGTLSKHLNALIASNFVIKYVPFGFKKNSEHYKLIDPFCLFYLQFLGNGNPHNNHYWQENVTAQHVVTWRGFAFENVCFNHVEQIKNALRIGGVQSNNSAWSKRSDDELGAQIDLLIERNDNVINMCELKYYSGNYTINNTDYEKLLHRQQLLADSVSKKSTIHSTLVTTFGLTQNQYSGFFTNVITIDDLFV